MTMYNKLEPSEELLQIVAECCNCLQIPLPKLKPVRKLPSASKTVRTMLEYSPTTGAFTVLLRIDAKMDYDTVFAIAHELRHEYQIIHKMFNISDHRESGTGNTIHDYNMQPEEIDAHAFAYNYMLDYYGIRMLFLPLSADVKKAIMQRAEEIRK